MVDGFELQKTTDTHIDEFKKTHEIRLNNYSIIIAP